MKTLTSEQIAEVIRIGRPVKKARVTQEFGKSKYKKLQGWYESFGWLGHNGIDFGAPIGEYAYAVFSGTVVGSYWSDGGGNIVSYETDWLIHDKTKIKFKLRFYYLHLSESLVNVGDRVELGQKICKIGNTGYYTTGSHLHFHITPYYQIDARVVADLGNGYDGAIDPSCLFVDAGWRRLPVDEYYGKERNWTLEYTFRFANTPVGAVITPFLSARVESARYVHKRLLKEGRKPPHLTDRETNAIIYGSWDLDYVLNPAMFAMWGWYSKAEVEEAKRDGVNLSTPLIAG